MSGARRAILIFLAVALPGLCTGLAMAAAPTDPQAGSQQPLQIMRVAQGLDRAGPLSDVPVLVADTGLDLDHPDLASRLLVSPPPPGSDFAGQPNGCNYPANFTAVPDNDPSDPAGCSGHGTAVAGVLGAAWNNGAGGAGVAPNAKFIPFRTCYDNDQCFQYVQAAAINRAADEYGARVVSMSWISGDAEDDFRKAIASHPNTLFVTIPSGNGGATDADPDAANRAPCSLNLPNVICVTTSSPTDQPSCGDYGATLVDVAVPTENSVTTTNGGGFGATGCATSYAAPAAAGLATILFGIAPQATAAEVRTAIIQGARPVGAWSGKSVSGGVADLVGAVDALRAGVDSLPPETTVKGPKGVIYKSKAKFRFSSDDPAATFECKLDRRPFKGCTSPKKVKNLDAGRHKFKVRSIDPAGNVDPTPAKFKFRVA